MIKDMWKNRWLLSLIAMHEWPDEADYYSRQAVIQQAQYVMYEAQERAGAHK
jgi:hypothetical protein